VVQLVEAERACARSDECLHFCLVLCVKTMLAHAGNRMSLRLRSLIDGVMRPCIDQKLPTTQEALASSLHSCVVVGRGLDWPFEFTPRTAARGRCNRPCATCSESTFVCIKIENELAVKIPAKIVRSHYRMELGRRCRPF
jgi:hypothetical protein